jgi:hypothetical protein
MPDKDMKFGTKSNENEVIIPVLNNLSYIRLRFTNI